MNKPKILLLSLDFPQWHDAAKFTYDCNFGLEEALQIYGIDCTTIPLLYNGGGFPGLKWLDVVRGHLNGRKFDQLWFDVGHTEYTPEFLEYLTAVAPTRIGFLLESTEFHPLESAVSRESRTKKFGANYPVATHLVVNDEADHELFNNKGGRPALWWAGGHLPKRLVAESPLASTDSAATFHGTLYGERAKWFSDPLLQGLLAKGTSLEDSTPYPAQWNQLSGQIQAILSADKQLCEKSFFQYINFVRTARRETYSLWLKSVAAGSAVVNLPQFGKSYASRVPQGIAAGRAVVSWEIPDRPRTRALYENGKEILLYSQNSPAELAGHLKRLRADSRFGQEIARNALAKFARYHTTEKFVGDLFRWIDSGSEPDYGDGMGVQKSPSKLQSLPVNTKSSNAFESLPKNGRRVVAHNDFEKLMDRGLCSPEKPLRLHLGCGEQHFDGYINIDYPSEQHNVMSVKPDYEANITELNFPDGSVDEIRLHHVFEHFNRVTALGMLIKWQKWLKVGGRLQIETPDLIGSAEILTSNLPWNVKMGTVRHLTGDQAASWAYHVEHWFPERYKHTLTHLGFGQVQTESVRWQKEPYLSNVHAVAIKSSVLSMDQLVKAADELLWESTVAPAEKPTYEVWRMQLRQVLQNNPCGPANIHVNSAGPATQPEPSASTSDENRAPLPLRQNLPLAEIHDFNQRGRDRWVKEKAASVQAGSRVLDIGAGTCLYRPLFAHCEYKTHDFKKYEGSEKHGGSKAYGEIDYVSEILAIPVPDHSFDVIICTEVLEHVPEPIKVLKEIARILRPGGRAFITAPLGSGLHQLPFHFYGGYTPEWYKRFSAEAGLDAVEITPNGGFFKHLAQECARAGGLFAQKPELHGKDAKEMYTLLVENLPRLFFAMDEKCFDERFTVGYFVEVGKPAKKAENLPTRELNQTTQRPSPPPVVVKLMGGLGNQMFQYAAGLAVADKNGASLELDLTFLQDKTQLPGLTQRSYGLGIFPMIRGCKLVTDSRQLQGGLQAINEKCFHYDPTFTEIPTGVLLQGYWQSPKYFETVASIVRSKFTLSPSLGDSVESLVNQIRAGDSICLHVRRGDMANNPDTAAVHGTCTLGYYQAACDQLACIHPNAHFYVFSDDPDWCLANDLTGGRPRTVIRHEVATGGEAIDLYLMQLCKHFIIANSTFSWWAAFLSPSAGKTVIAPDPWFSDPSMDTADLLPKEWIRLCRAPGPTLGDLALVPLVSVIIPCYNQAHYLQEAVESVVSQTFPNWEAIIVNDGSPDDTSRVAKDIIARHPGLRIRLIEQANGGLARARNAGIEAAKGKYVVPLDSDDKLAPTYLEKTTTYLETHAEAKLVTTGRRDFGASNTQHSFVKYTLQQIIRNNCISYCTLYRREVWVSVGGYNPNMIWGYEDWNFWISCAERGWIPDVISEALFYYRVKSSSMLVNAVKHDTELRAQIVVNHPRLYDERLLATAQSILDASRQKRAKAEHVRATPQFFPQGLDAGITPVSGVEAAVESNSALELAPTV